jgi:hypothetical protein
MDDPGYGQYICLDSEISIGNIGNTINRKKNEPMFIGGTSVIHNNYYSSELFHNDMEEESSITMLGIILASCRMYVSFKMWFTWKK